MKLSEKMQEAIRQSKGRKIKELKTGTIFSYGENPYADMQIENCLFCDMFPEEVKNPSNYYGFNRNDYILL